MGYTFQMDRGGDCRDKLSIIKSEVKCDELIEKILGISDKKRRPYKTHCPFHNDTTPSLNIYLERWSCFVCNLHGDSIEFIKRYLKIGFIEAVDYLYHDYLGYGKASSSQRWMKNPFSASYIPTMETHFPSKEERISHCEQILPVYLFPYFMLAERCGDELLSHVIIEPTFVLPWKNYTAIEWIAYWHNIPASEELECIRIWEEWCRRSETYHRSSVAWERIRISMKEKISLG